MKKLFVCLFLLAFVVSSVSLGAVAKSKKKAAKKPAKIVKTVKPVEEGYDSSINTAPASVKPVSNKGGLVVSPKLAFNNGLTSAIGLGCEFAMPVMPSIDGMGEFVFVPGNGYSIIEIGGNAIYKFPPVEKMPANFYAGGGLTYAMVNWGTYSQAAGADSGIGFQVIGGADIPIEGMGTAFAQLRYSNINVKQPDFTFGGITIPGATYNVGGFGLEGGYRFAF